MSRRQAYDLGLFESQLLSKSNPPKEFKPLQVELQIKDGGVAGDSFINKLGKDADRIIRIDPNNAVQPRYVGAHEAAHMSTLNYTPTDGWKQTRNMFDDELKPLLDIQMKNAQHLANQLEIDPKKICRNSIEVK